MADLENLGGAFGAPIDIRPILPLQRSSFLDLLAGLGADEWAREAVPGWSVGDVAAHVLHDHARRLAATRDGHRVDLPPGDTLPERLDAANEAFVAVARQLSPPLLIDLIGHLGPQLDALWAGQDLDADADADVSWAGDGPTPRWLDLARELTELWVHEQQVRDAVGRPGFDGPDVLGAVVDTFARALPFTLRHVDRPPGARARLRVTGPAGGTWDAVRDGGRWVPAAPGGVPEAEVTMDQDTFWRLAARRVTVAEARGRAQRSGDEVMTAVMTTLLAVVRAPDDAAPAALAGAPSTGDTDVTLRPVVAADLDVFAAMMTDADAGGRHQWFGHTSGNELRRRFAEDGLLGPAGGVLTVLHDGDVAGRVDWFTSMWGRPATSSCWSVAIALLPAYRGRGIGTRAQRLLVDYLFAHTRVERIQAWTDVGNVAEQRALARAGFTLEGTLRRAQWRDGAWHDQLLYSVLRGDARP